MPNDVLWEKVESVTAVSSAANTVSPVPFRFAVNPVSVEWLPGYAIRTPCSNPSRGPALDRQVASH